MICHCLISLAVSGLLGSSAAVASETDFDPWGFPKSEEFRAQIEYWRTGPYLMEVTNLVMTSGRHIEPWIFTVGAIDGVWYHEGSRFGPVADHVLDLESLKGFHVTSAEIHLDIQQERQVTAGEPGSDPIFGRAIHIYSLLHPRHRINYLGESYIDTWSQFRPTLGELEQNRQFSPLAANRGELPTPESWKTLSEEDIARLSELDSQWRDSYPWTQLSKSDLVGCTLLQFRMPVAGRTDHWEILVSVVTCPDTGRVLAWWTSLTSGGQVYVHENQNLLAEYYYALHEDLLPVGAQVVVHKQAHTQRWRQVANAEELTPQHFADRLNWIDDCTTASIPKEGAQKVVSCEEAFAFVAKVLGVE